MPGRRLHQAGCPATAALQGTGRPRRQAPAPAAQGPRRQSLALLHLAAHHGPLRSIAGNTR
ncbi:hypothetical protein, partial [Paenibacillus sp. MAEPY1]|uniref:hypothetical protein n=1 Tax=Paenibacillus sp. MAEPY1 TaxID=1395586 RepID=UPI001F373908